MKTFEEKLRCCLEFLESIKQGYKYEITIHKPLSDSRITVSVVGECLGDRSLPHVFLTTGVHLWQDIPDEIIKTAEKNIDDELKKNEKLIEEANLRMAALKMRKKTLEDLKSKLEE